MNTGGEDMRVCTMRALHKLTDSARGAALCDLSIVHTRLVNTITKEIYPAAIDITGGVIVNIRRDAAQSRGRETYDAHMCYALPGWIDTHTHVECSMLTPENFGKAAAVWGNTTVITDPHEIANVIGLSGVEQMEASAARGPIRQFYLAPSCVPSAPGKESSGAAFGAAKIHRMLKSPSCLGLAELMDYQGILSGDEKMLSILGAGFECDAFLQGHSAGLQGDRLAAYLSCGIQSDHESNTVEAVLARARAGMWVDIRESSMSDSIPAAAGAIRQLHGEGRFALCTDGNTASQIVQHGTIGHVAARLIREFGFDPLDIIAMGTRCAAEEYHLEDLGVLAPGYVADIQLVEDLHGFDQQPPAAVFVAGRLTAEHGTLIACPPTEAMPERNTVCLPQALCEEIFRLRMPDCTAAAPQVLIFDAARQDAHYAPLPVHNGIVQLPENRGELCYLAIFNRYGTGRRVVCVAANTGLREGALATTVCHDCHNLAIIYKEPADALLAMQTLQACGGGICTVKDHCIHTVLPLPVAGLMSNRPAEEMAQAVDAMNHAVLEICEPFKAERNPMFRLSCIALPCSPRVVVTDLGIWDAAHQKPLSSILLE